jgi:hypothetical protein
MATIQGRTWTDKEGRQRTNYRVQIRRRGFPPVTATFERKTDAAKWARETEADIQRGLRFPQHEAERHTLADLVDRQLEHVKLHRPHDYAEPGDREPLSSGAQQGIRQCREGMALAARQPAAQHQQARGAARARSVSLRTMSGQHYSSRAASPSTGPCT